MPASREETKLMRPAPYPGKHRPQKGTNVRMAAMGWLLRSLDAMAPAAAERLLWRLFSTPRRPRPARDPRADGLEAQPLHVASPARRRLAAWTWGTGPAVLLVHGWSGHAGQMVAFIRPLVEAGFKVAAFDQPAHGQSAGKRTHMLEFREALLAVGAALGPLEGIVAHSLGGTAAVLAMDRGLATRRVALLAPPLDPPLFMQAFAGSLGLAPARAVTLAQNIAAWVRKDIGERDVRVVAASLTLPALIVHDDGDRAVPHEHGRAMAATWPNARFLSVTGHGHSRMLAAPAVVAAVTSFIAGGGATAGTGTGHRIPPPAVALRSQTS
jgi:pimeloyl-ACP methyl ester carboxylesterase